MRKIRLSSYLDRLLSKAHRIDFTAKDRIVVFSDLHLGNGGKNDDFLHNGAAFERILQNYYYKNNYRLVLNGDIEELMRFSHDSIHQAWPELYGVLKTFEKKKRLHRIFGNHDFMYATKLMNKLQAKPDEALVFHNKGREILVLHGHQSNALHTKLHLFASFILRYLARPLNMRNYTVAFNNRKKFRVEELLYKFARRHKIAVILGHTHRPLFESFSKKDNLKYQIEKLCRRYSKVDDAKRSKLSLKIRQYHQELQQVLQRGEKHNPPGTLYDMDNLIPCLFNSGSGIGRSGITAIELYEGRIALVHWLNLEEHGHMVAVKKGKMTEVAGCPYVRVLLKEDDLEYIFTRIRLLT